MYDPFATPWTVARQAPLFMEFPKQEYWHGLPFLTLGIFPTQESNPGLLFGRGFFTTEVPVVYSGLLDFYIMSFFCSRNLMYPRVLLAVTISQNFLLLHNLIGFRNCGQMFYSMSLNCDFSDAFLMIKLGLYFWTDPEISANVITLYQENILLT